MGPIYSKTRKLECRDDLRNCYKGTLELCVETGITSVAFSGISTGVYGHPIDDAASIACDEVRKFLQSEKGEKVNAGNNISLSLSLFGNSLSQALG